MLKNSVRFVPKLVGLMFSATGILLSIALFRRYKGLHWFWGTKTDPVEDADETDQLPIKEHLKKTWVFVKQYFLYSPDRWKAWGLLFGALLSVAVSVILISALSSCITSFWTALTVKDLPLLLKSSQTFAYLITAIVISSSAEDWCVKKLCNRWRGWLSKIYTDELTINNTYLKLTRSVFEQGGQRIQEDVKNLIDLTVSLGLGLFRSILSLTMFIGTLWIVGGALPVTVFGAMITIPGYLVWVALSFSLFTSLITKKIGASLMGLNNKQEHLEAVTRSGLYTLLNPYNAENIAQEEGGTYYKKSLNNKFASFIKNADKKIIVETKLTAFQIFCEYIPNLLPYVATAPLYFAGLLELAQLLQMGFAFGEVNSGLGWFVNSYQELSQCKTSMRRILELEERLREKPDPKLDAIIVRENAQNDSLVVKNLSVHHPNESKYLMRDLNFVFKRKEHVIIQGSSGLGKSTLFKVFKGTFSRGEGEIYIPKGVNINVQPQVPSIDYETTLRAVLAYPESETKYDDEKYKSALRAVGGMDAFIEKLDKKCDGLSGGQQKRIAFARVLLQKPQWLFLDETTTGIGPRVEAFLYDLLKRELIDTTIISISHQPSSVQHHDRLIVLEAMDEDGLIHVTDTKIRKKCVETKTTPVVKENKPIRSKVHSRGSNVRLFQVNTATTKVTDDEQCFKYKIS